MQEFYTDSEYKESKKTKHFKYGSNNYLDWQLNYNFCRSILLKYGSSEQEFNNNSYVDNYYKYFRCLEKGGNYGY